MSLAAWLHFMRARLMLLWRNKEAAAREYQSALGYDANFQPAVTGLAFLAAGEQRFTDAEQWFHRALALRSNDALVLFNLGYLCDRSGRHAEAVGHFRRAVEQKPKFDQAWYGLGMAHAAQGQHAEAVTALERAGELEPMNGHVWYALGMALHHSHQPERVAVVINHLNRFDRQQTRRLIQDTERADLAHLVKDLVV